MLDDAFFSSPLWLKARLETGNHASIEVLTEFLRFDVCWTLRQNEFQKNKYERVGMFIKKYDFAEEVAACRSAVSTSIEEERVGASHMQSTETEQAVKQLYEVILALASHTGQIEERLAKAGAQLLTIDSAVLPNDVKGKLEEIRRELNHLYPDPLVWQGVDHQKAIALATEIVLLYDSINVKKGLRS